MAKSEHADETNILQVVSILGVMFIFLAPLGQPKFHEF